MIEVGAYKDQKVGVFGLARSGLAACRALTGGGAKVLPWDDDEVARAAALEPPVDLYQESFEALAALIVSPGVPLTFPEPHPLVKKAQVAGVPVLGDMELFEKARNTLPVHRLVAVTGTNGKSTTTALLAHTLTENGLDALGAGNIGIPVLDITPLPEGGVYVFEMSSFQLDLTESLEPEIAILLNISPDHLDRHGSMDGYVAAKQRVFDLQTRDGVAIIGIDDLYGRRLAAALSQKVIPISCEGPLDNGVYVVDGILYDAMAGPAKAAKTIGEVGHGRALRGKHNGQNAAAVYAAARELGVAAEKILPAFQTFEGLPHRLEIVGERDGILFINDSKASNTGSALRSLEAFENIYWIVGGLFKEESLEMFMPVMKNVKKAFLIGEDDSIFADFLAGKADFEHCGTLDSAVQAAAAGAREKGGVVLLAPACASFDQFKNFEERGEVFRKAALKLIAGGNA
ncbi:MAG: UDP-N-acetylmuramoyl-L-alanine--D-glutamate ligase [Alphaproteobacteria bacterium]|nr:MAG: UDP-N-acetylmuramoyl-L-alanine--D-glutamate ligase [Alphaproteobacteria bacterium]